MHKTILKEHKIADKKLDVISDDFFKLISKINNKELSDKYIEFLEQRNKCNEIYTKIIEISFGIKNNNTFIEFTPTQLKALKSAISTLSSMMEECKITQKEVKLIDKALNKANVLRIYK